MPEPSGPWQPAQPARKSALPSTADWSAAGGCAAIDRDRMPQTRVSAMASRTSNNHDGVFQPRAYGRGDIIERPRISTRERAPKRPPIANENRPDDV